MPRSILGNNILKRRPSVRLFQAYQKVQGRVKNSRRKLLVKKIKSPELYRVVNIRCKLPSSTAIFKKPPPIIKNENEESLRRFKERQKEIREKYSPAKVKEIYVNPSRNKMMKKYVNSAVRMSTSRNSSAATENPEPKKMLAVTNIPTLTKSVPNNPKRETTYKNPPFTSLNNLPLNIKSTLLSPLNTKERATNTETSHPLSADKVLSEAHRMVWSWFFNGLVSPNLRQKSATKSNLKT